MPVGDDTVSLIEARRRLRTDHALLNEAIDGLSADALAADHRTTAGPLGDFCGSLHDLVAHVVMWDEINLAVLGEAEAGRKPHWSTDPRWETAEAGRALNRGGVAAGRFLPASLLRHRLDAVQDSLYARFDGYAEADWSGPVTELGPLATRVWTVPGHAAFWHAAIHLGLLPSP